MFFINEVLASQLILLARAVVEIVRKNGAGSDGVPDGGFSVIESKVARLEDQLTEIEQMIE